MMRMLGEVFMLMYGFGKSVGGRWSVIVPFITMVAWILVFSTRSRKAHHAGQSVVPSTSLRMAMVFSRTSLAILMFLEIVGAVCFAVLFWILRDGLGPNAVESHGVLSLCHFTTLYSGVLIVFGVAFIPLFILYGRLAKR